MNLNDYLLVKAFKSAKRRDQFNKGEIYLSSTANFWKLENAFQQDREGEIFSSKGRFNLYRGFDNIQKILEESSTKSDIHKRIMEENPEAFWGIADYVNLRLEGYLCCFYLLPKNAVSFTQSTLSITCKLERSGISLFLNNYLEESSAHDFYVSIYDTVIFCDTFFKNMRERGYSINYGQVKYEDIDEETKIERFQNNDFSSILFTKPTKFSYQKEFRIFLTKPNEPMKDHIIENGIEIEKSRYASFDYVNLISNNQL